MAIRRIQNKRAASSVWRSQNPVLLPRELGLETDTGKFKFGDGEHEWNSLGYGGGLETWTFVMDDDSETEIVKEVAAWTSGT